MKQELGEEFRPDPEEAMEGHIKVREDITEHADGEHSDDADGQVKTVRIGPQKHDSKEGEVSQ